MKLLLTILMLIFPIFCLADSIKCYSYNKLIYKGKIINYGYEDSIFAFQEKKSGNIFIYNGNCLIELGT